MDDYEYCDVRTCFSLAEMAVLLRDGGELFACHNHHSALVAQMLAGQVEARLLVSGQHTTCRRPQGT